MAKTAIQLITSALAKQHNLSAADAAAFVDAFFDIISSELKNGNQVKIKGLGTFKVQAVKPRESVNVNTGERVLIEGHDKISFTPDTVMKELVNKPFSQFETVVINDGVDTEELERVPSEDSSDEVKSELVDETTTKNTSEEKLLVEEERTEVEDTKDETNNISSVKGGAEIEAEDNLNEKNLPIDVIEEPTTEENEAIFDSKEKPSNLEEKKEEKQEVAKEVDSKVDSIVESKVDAIVEPKVEEETIEVEVKSVQSVPNTSEEREESSNENNIDKKELPNSSEPTNISEDEDTDVESSENGILKKVALVAFIVIICLGIFLWARMSSTNSKKKTKEVAEQVNTSEDHSSLGTQTVSADTTSVTKVHKTPEKKETAKVDSFMALNSDPRIRYGAYNIIGIDRIVVLKKGETMEKYSRKTLGADMVGYFQVLNCRKTMQAGDTMKVPKVELRPEYRK
ncbi:HU family DNA-binding protein [Prevotella melaninogenica]|uniref:HU family DNA-binding protein n=1 Tax=Prevotella melaninogenica TaxID=28132 RepID=UPI001C606948|nr:HU family DNA-binding protein [Prevotella melaninogenica]MBW4740402.1 HU family DNA-binding protein [Prevotella melaninogenica]MBW4911967.1 HU family DNA-binding protein [Prevotella melaninogenica]